MLSEKDLRNFFNLNNFSTPFTWFLSFAVMLKAANLINKYLSDMKISSKEGLLASITSFTKTSFLNRYICKK